MSQALAQTTLYTEEDYHNLPENVRAELINGQFYAMSAPSRIHQEILGTLYRIIANHIVSKKGPCKVYPAPFAVKLSEDVKTVVEPDISVICDRDKLTDNPAHDHVLKLHLYMDAGVREYWIVDPTQKMVYVYHLVMEEFKMTAHTFQDKIKAGIYDDLWIDFSGLDL